MNLDDKETGMQMRTMCIDFSGCETIQHYRLPPVIIIPAFLESDPSDPSNLTETDMQRNKVLLRNAIKTHQIDHAQRDAGFKEENGRPPNCCEPVVTFE